MLAHELRTPITTIYAGSAVLARDEDLLPAMRRELASDVYHEAARLFRAVEDLLVLTRLEHDAVQRDPRADLHDPRRGRRDPDRGAALARAPRHAPARTGRRHPPPPTRTPWRMRCAISSPMSPGAPPVPTDLEVAVSGEDEQVACRLLDRTGTLSAEDRAALFELPARDPGPGPSARGSRCTWPVG